MERVIGGPGQGQGGAPNYRFDSEDRCRNAEPAVPPPVASRRAESKMTRHLPRDLTERRLQRVVRKGGEGQPLQGCVVVRRESRTLSFTQTQTARINKTDVVKNGRQNAGNPSSTLLTAPPPPPPPPPPPVANRKRVLSSPDQITGGE
ncbi:hypothetical protein C0Q70_09736 [Pomacea canaliculata]|uniref:Uncharacterized protein n=1 Tax=Pomacea canaliculata TaxID=400727 RepID=A0A2T7PAL9_POMCA|nr:hypothetical protein C0Q70_09736 [Pomacea canaliculata]